MLFNSIDFAIFLPIVFVLYWFVFKNQLKAQNLLIAVASYVFYGWWDWRFLSLILFSTFVDFAIGRRLSQQHHKGKRRILLWLSIAVNLGFLGFFKYYNFFLDNFIAAFSFFGSSLSGRTLNVILPVGISFYTFQTMSYTIDVFKKKLEPTKDFISFAAFVSFFPQLVAGPIERATNLLPQFYSKRSFNYSLAVEGLRQILWGLFKKVVIADNCAEYTNIIFNNSHELSGSSLLVGALFFTFQIYGDFSGYSDIAIGTSRLFGFNLMKNFAFPYFSRDIAEFWRRWHISLSTWFRDYLYIPLGGSRGGLWTKVRNTFIIFIVSGFWHGANWTFIVWGALNALYFMPLLLRGNNRNNLNVIAEKSFLPSLKEVSQVIFTFSLTVIAWIFFRADSIFHALEILSEIFSNSILTIPDFDKRHKAFFFLPLIIVLIAIEWIGRREEFALSRIELKWKKPIRYVIYYSILVAVITYAGQEQQFIYFQF